MIGFVKQPKLGPLWCKFCRYFGGEVLCFLPTVWRLVWDVSELNICADAVMMKVTNQPQPFYGHYTGQRALAGASS